MLFYEIQSLIYLCSELLVHGAGMRDSEFDTHEAFHLEYRDVPVSIG
jgi:hypothetical protein